MNINQLKDKLRKRKTSIWYKNVLNERLLKALKEKDSLYVDGSGLINFIFFKGGFIHGLFS